jgi:ankyrin repeat protein
VPDAAAIAAIIAAAGEGDAVAVSRLLAGDPELATSTNMFGAGGVHAAHFAGQVDLRNELLARRGALDIWTAAELGFTDDVRALLTEDPALLDAHRAGQGDSPLHAACYWGQVDTARSLIAAGADARAHTSDDFLRIGTLGAAAATPDVPNPSDDEQVCIDLCRVLLDAGADVNCRRRDGMTALHTAGYRGLATLAAFLLERGADVSVRAKGDGAHAGETPAETAEARGHVSLAQWLREQAR